MTAYAAPGRLESGAVTTVHKSATCDSADGPLQPVDRDELTSATDCNTCGPGWGDDRLSHLRGDHE